MRTLRYDSPDFPSDFTLFSWGDIHVGNNAMDVGKVEKFCRMVRATKNGFAAFGGDQIESIAVDDKRFSFDCHVSPIDGSDLEEPISAIGSRIDFQRDYFLHLFGTLKDRTLWVLDGNHERRLANTYRVNRSIYRGPGTPGWAGA